MSSAAVVVLQADISLSHNTKVRDSESTVRETGVKATRRAWDFAGRETEETGETQGIQTTSAFVCQSVAENRIWVTWHFMLEQEKHNSVVNRKDDGGCIRTFSSQVNTDRQHCISLCWSDEPNPGWGGGDFSDSDITKKRNIYNPNRYYSRPTQSTVWSISTVLAQTERNLINQKQN